MRLAVLAALLFGAVPASVYGQAMEPDQVPISFALTTNPHTYNAKSTAAGGVLGGRSNGSLLGIDSVVNWSSYFYEQGFDSFGKIQFTWQYTMVGRAPFGTGESEGSEETTEIRAPVVPGSLDLRNFDGSPRFVDGKRLFSDGTRYVNPVLNSPVFSNTSYGSSASPTQYTDAVQRAEFFNKAASDWHTQLRPRVGTPRTMVLIRGTYRFALNADGSCCAFVFIDEGTFLRTSLASRRCLDWLRAGSLRRNTTGNAASRTLDRRSRGELRLTPASFPFSRPTFALRVGILTFPRSPSSAFDRTNKVIDSRRLHSVTFPPWRSEPSSCGDRFPAS
jgi:hypothetical protein